MLIPVLLASLACGGSARAGGEIQVYVLLPATGQVAFVDAVAGHVLRVVLVPRGAGPIAAATDGSRVLVANTRLGQVTAVDGVDGRRRWTISGLGRPVALSVVPWAPYAVLADARGWIDIMSLARGSLVARIHVAAPRAISLANGHLWVVGGRGDRLTQIDLSYPTRPQVVAQRRVPEVRALVAGDTAVELASRDNRLSSIDAVDGARSLRARLPEPIHQLLPGYRGAIWASVGSGHVIALRARDARIVGRMQVSAGSRLEILGGWLAAVHGRTLQMLVLGTARHGTPTTLPGVAGSFAYAVL